MKTDKPLWQRCVAQPVIGQDRIEHAADLTGRDQKRRILAEDVGEVATEREVIDPLGHLDNRLRIRIAGSRARAQGVESIGFP